MTKLCASKHYKNIIFDFGNVLGEFKIDQLLDECCQSHHEHLKKIIFHDWDNYDGGKYQQDEYVKSCLNLASEDEKEKILSFFKDWYLRLHPIDEMHQWIMQLKNEGYHLYILSNAPIIFEEHIDIYPNMSLFDGKVFSGRIQLAKPDIRIYQYLLDKYHLKADECFFIDDKKENVEAAMQIGIKGMVYDHNLDMIRQKVNGDCFFN
ncbi:MAG: HAD family hydrolase [Traorella sp.]